MTVLFLLEVAIVSALALAVGWWLETYHGARLDALARWLDME